MNCIPVTAEDLKYLVDCFANSAYVFMAIGFVLGVALVASYVLLRTRGE